MSDIKYLSFTQVDPKELMTLLNADSLRIHLVYHPAFTNTSIQQWLQEKHKIDAIKGCRVRLVSIDGVLAGWCGIQPDDDGVEIAIVLSQRYWGYGIPIFKTLMQWAGELGHQTVRFHLLDSRREYKALAKMATKVHHTQMLGRNFTTYHLSVT